MDGWMDGWMEGWVEVKALLWVGAIKSNFKEASWKIILPDTVRFLCLNQPEWFSPKARKLSICHNLLYKY
jgi:hypothetical protein